MNPPSISVIISTYNSPEWLRKVLIGYDQQTLENFEVVIADDGSGIATKTLIEKFKTRASYKINHVWQEDNGFQKSQILNKALVACQGDYIIMSDGDCIPRADFIEIHFKEREVGYFLSGGYYKLPMDISEAITEEDIIHGRCFNLKWLKSKGLPSSFKNNKLTATRLTSGILNSLTTTKATWNGHNASGWKSDILAVNGFDERMQYGGQDRELGERLMNYDIKGKQIRYSAVCLHLDHPRGYKTKASIEKNLAIRKHTKQHKVIKTDFGIEQSED